jgi:hypothetical protein
MNRISLAVFALVLGSPGGLLAWDSASSVGRFPCQARILGQEAGPDWLVRHLEPSGRIAVSLLPQEYRGYGPALNPTVQFSTTGMSDTGQSAGHARISGWQQAGIYGLEFGGAAVGTCIAAAGAFGVMAAIGPAPLQRNVGLMAFLVANPCLSATGVYFGGRLAGQRGSFWPTLVGGLAGGAVGIAGAYGYGRYWGSRPGYSGYWGTTQTVVVSACVLVPPALGAVIAYNVWRSNDSK